MFDQPNPNQPINPVGQNPAPRGPAVVEDMFDSVDSGIGGSKSAAGPMPPPPPRPSAPVPLDSAPSFMGPVGPSSAPTAPVNDFSNVPPGGVIPSVGSELAGGSFLIKNKKFFIIGLSALLVVVVGVGGWFAYAKFFKQSAAPKTNTNNVNTSQNTINIGSTNNQPTVTNTANVNTNVNVNTEPVISETADSDADGLIDTEEKTLGTDPNSVDTDNDGLFDREEVRVYSTDPLKADTDDDGYLDGEEVKGGYDPKGQGKLFKTE